MLPYFTKRALKRSGKGIFQRKVYRLYMELFRYSAVFAIVMFIKPYWLDLCDIHLIVLFKFIGESTDHLSSVVVFQFGSFEFLTRFWHNVVGEQPEYWRPVVHSACGLAAGCSATVCSMPLDVIRTRFVTQSEPKV